jgi:hypothetical protein
MDYSSTKLLLPVIFLFTFGFAQTYTTNFDLAENPISEGGKWMHKDATLTLVKTTGGIACGTQTGSGGYDDSNAYLTGFGTDYVIEGTIYKKSGLSGPFREVELLLRWTDDNPLRNTSYGPTHANGYEINIAYSGQYMNLGRWMGAALVMPTPPVPANGDKFKAQIVGQTITCWWNNVQIFQYTDNDAALKVTTGNPGIGFYITQGAQNDDFGFTSLTVTSLSTGAKQYNNVSIPSNFSLKQNSSNSISYMVPAQSLVSIVVYDALGREMTTLAHGIMTVGSYSTRFSGSEMAGGIYAIKRTSGSSAQALTIPLER